MRLSEKQRKEYVEMRGDARVRCRIYAAGSILGIFLDVRAFCTNADTLLQEITTVATLTCFVLFMYQMSRADFAELMLDTDKK